MNHLKFGLVISTFLFIPLNVKADFSILDSEADPLFRNSSIDNLGNSRKERTGFDNKWGMDINSSMEVDLSEWGGRIPSCEEAPGCPICIK